MLFIWKDAYYGYLLWALASSVAMCRAKYLQYVPAIGTSHSSSCAYFSRSYFAAAHLHGASSSHSFISQYIVETVTYFRSVDFKNAALVHSTSLAKVPYELFKHCIRNPARKYEQFRQVNKYLLLSNKYLLLKKISSKRCICTRDVLRRSTTSPVKRHLRNNLIFISFRSLGIQIKIK